MESLTKNSTKEELQRLRDWTYQREQEIDQIEEYGLPVDFQRNMPIPATDKYWVHREFDHSTMLLANLALMNQPLEFKKMPVVVLKQEETHDEGSHSFLSFTNKPDKQLANLNEISAKLCNGTIPTDKPLELTTVTQILNQDKTSGFIEPQKPKKRSRRKSSTATDTSEHVPILERLKAHPCTTEHQYNPITKRMNKIITCNYPNCGKKFTKTWNILDHFKVHTGDKPYKCQNCSKAFSQKGNLTKHLKLHSKCSKAISGR